MSRLKSLVVKTVCDIERTQKATGYGHIFFVGVASILRYSSGIHTTHEEIRGNRNTGEHKKVCPGYQNISVTGRKVVCGWIPSLAGNYFPAFLEPRTSFLCISVKSVR